MSREKLKDFLNSIGKANVDKISYVIDTSEESSNKDLGTDPNSGEPIINIRESLSGDYVKFITEESKNISTFRGGNTLNPTYKRGDNITQPDQSSVDDPYVPPSESYNYKNSNYIGSDLTIAKFIDKIGEKPGINGTNISAPNESLVDLTKEALKENNRHFSSDEINTFDNDKTFTSQRKLGQYDKDITEKSVLSYDRLKSIGKSILLSSGGWVNYDDSGKPLLVNPDSVSLSPGSVKNLNLSPGLKTDYDNTKARYAYNAPADANDFSTRMDRNIPESEVEKVGQTFYNSMFL